MGSSSRTSWTSRDSMRDRSSRSSTSAWSRTAFRSMTRTKVAAAGGSCSMTMGRVSAAVRMAVTGVLSSCDTLATKSRRMVSSRRRSVTSTKIANTPRPSSGASGAARTCSRRGASPSTTISRSTLADSAAASSSKPCSSAWLKTSSGVEPITSEDSSNSSRSAGFTSATRPTASTIRSPSFMPERTPANRSRSLRSPARVASSRAASCSGPRPAPAAAIARRDLRGPFGSPDPRARAMRVSARSRRRVRARTSTATSRAITTAATSAPAPRPTIPVAEDAAGPTASGAASEGAARARRTAKRMGTRTDAPRASAPGVKKPPLLARRRTGIPRRARFRCSRGRSPASRADA